MVRGTEKRVIYLKDPQSKLFEGAFFLLREPSELSGIKDCDIVEEANRILWEGEADHGKGKLMLPEEKGREKLLFFSLGFALSALFFAGILLLFL